MRPPLKKKEKSDHNGLALILLILILIGAAVAYARMPKFQGFVDARAPWFKPGVGHFLLKIVPGGAAQGSGGDAAPGSFDLATFAAHPESWPRSIAIKAETEFPAVLNGKTVGSVRVPAGTQVHLLKVENGQLGVEYQGGGKWLAPGATDLSQRVQTGSGSPP